MSKEVYPPMHTAEHLLNQTMIRLFDSGRCYSAHIEKKKSKCDYRFDRALTDKEIAEIENKMNEMIGKDLPVTREFLSFNEVKDKYNLDRLPAEADTNRIRIVKVGDYDACPCIGQHVTSTRELGVFKIISSDFSDGVLRIRFKLIQ